MTYRVAHLHSAEGYSVSCPGLPGCCSQGQSEAEALENIKIAIQDYLATVDELTQGAETRLVDVATA